LAFSITLLRDGFAVMRRAREGMLSESEGSPPLVGRGPMLNGGVGFFGC